MREERIEVTAYAGYRGEESPRVLLLDGARVEVRRVLDQWTEEAADTRKKRRCFKVEGSDFRTHVVCYDEGKMAWLYRRS